MTILLSAFACDPTQGSEEGVGWTWAYHLSRLGHTVFVLTREHNRDAIERYVAYTKPPRLIFIYVRVPVIPFWMPGPGVYPYYICWQWLAYRAAKSLHAQHHFDVIHHITYGVFRNASYLFLLRAPFIFGPVGGGERSPKALRRSMSGAAKTHEFLRDLINILPRFDPLWRRMLGRAVRIVAKTGETQACFPRRVRGRTIIALENMVADAPVLAGLPTRGSPLRLLYAGRLLEMKGLHLALRALSLVNIPVTFTIVGRGPDEPRLRADVARLGLTGTVTFRDWLPRPQVLTLYASHDAVLFPSLHDSSGTVIMEAIAHGKPLICLDLGGPAVTVDQCCARIVTTRYKSEDEVVAGIAEAVIDFARMSASEWESMRRAALRRAATYGPEQVISRVYGTLLELPRYYNSGSDSE